MELMCVFVSMHSLSTCVGICRSLRPGQMVNQFPCENVITCKDLMAAVASRGNQGMAPSWLPMTFNLLYELPKLVHEYMKRKET